MSIYKPHFEKIITQTLKKFGFHSIAATNLLLGTAAQESRFGTYLWQINGSACGVFQMEPLTEMDIWGNYLHYHKNIMHKLQITTGVLSSCPNKLVENLPYAICMARIQYLRVPEKLPKASDLNGMARYWKKYYNTYLGAGTEEQFIMNYKKYVA